MTRKAIGSIPLVLVALVLVLLAACGGGATAPAAEASEGAAAEGGTWSGTVTRRWEETVEQRGDAMESKTTQKHEVIVQISSAQVDIGAWELTGNAEVVSTFTSDYMNRMSDLQGRPCNVHYTDDAKGNGSVEVEGGLEAGDGFYQFHVNVPGLQGTNETVRDDSGCGGPNKGETVPWQVATVTVSASGDLTDPDHISGSRETQEGAKERVTWDLRRSR